MDGQYPLGPVLYFNGLLYGITYDGGRGLVGTVFGVSASGGEPFLYSFKSGSLLQGHPGLIAANGLMYGTNGGGHSRHDGLVFSLSTSGTEQNVHIFRGGTDGSHPDSSLIDVDGTFYGTTAYGGTTGCTYGCGTVYSVTPSRMEHVIYRFKGGTDDGSGPSTPLAYVKGYGFYGTTGGGKYNNGTIFKITPSGKEIVLHSFSGGADGGSPQSGLLDVNGTLYGMTSSGGSTGNGTVFSLTP